MKLQSQIKNRVKILVAGSLVLFIVGFIFVSSFIIRLTAASATYEIVSFSNEEIIFRLSMGFLLVLSAIIALINSWVSSRKVFNFYRILAWLTVSIASSLLGIWLRMLDIKSLELPQDTKLTLLSIDYFHWGLVSLLLICAPLAIIIFLKKRKLANNADG